MPGLRAALVSTLLLARTASAGIPTCAQISIVEIFPGTDDCPNAQYVVLRMNVDLQGVVGGTRVETGSGSDTRTFATFPPGDAANALLDDVLLVATSQAESLFGIAADAVAPGDVLLDIPDGIVSYSCSADAVLYGAGGVGPGLVRGMALRKIGTTWSLGAPSPVNNAGDPGTMGTCPPEPDAGPEPELDAGAPDAEVHETNDEDDGCGCRMGAAPPAAPWMALLALAALGARRKP